MAEEHPFREGRDPPPLLKLIEPPWRYRRLPISGAEQRSRNGGVRVRIPARFGQEDQRLLERRSMHGAPERDLEAVQDVAVLSRNVDRQVTLVLLRDSADGLDQLPRRDTLEPAQRLVDEARVAVQQLPRGDIDGRRAPGATLVGVGDGG